LPIYVVIQKTEEANKSARYQRGRQMIQIKYVKTKSNLPVLEPVKKSLADAGHENPAHLVNNNAGHD
jgi:hypothetical protein